MGLSRDEAAALRSSAAAADGARSHALVTLLLHNGLHITEALSRDIAHLGWERGHRTLRLERKGGRVQTAPLAPATAEVLDAYIDERTEGPIFITATGARWSRRHAGRVMRRLAHEARLRSAAAIALHSARHTFATAALDAGVALRDVQAAMGHADPRTTMRYDRSRKSLDRHTTYAVTAYFRLIARATVSRMDAAVDLGLVALPVSPATVARYLADLEREYKPSTLRRRLASISAAHQLAGDPHPDPGVRTVWAGLRRRHGIAPR